MANIVIKRKVTLEFLGDEYKDSYLIFKAIPVVGYESLIKRIDDSKDNNSSMDRIIEVLEEYFIDGVFDGEKVLKEDLKQFDGDTLIKSFETLTGQKTVEGERQLDPLFESESTNTSTTEADTVQK
jgi:hypothetical protein